MTPPRAQRGTRMIAVWVGVLLVGALVVGPAHAQGPALILTPDPGTVTFRIGGAPADWLPPYRIAIDAQGNPWRLLTGTPWVQAYAQGGNLYVTLNRGAWSLGPDLRHCATIALQAFKLDDAGLPTAALSDSARVNVCVIRSL